MAKRNVQYVAVTKQRKKTGVVGNGCLLFFTGGISGPYWLTKWLFRQFGPRRTVAVTKYYGDAQPPQQQAQVPYPPIDYFSPQRPPTAWGGSPGTYPPGPQPPPSVQRQYPPTSRYGRPPEAPDDGGDAPVRRRS